MLQIGETLVSLQVINQRFCCDLKFCLGNCCVKGDSGAPLEAEEVGQLTSEYEKIKPFLRAEGVAAIEKQGVWILDDDGEQVTPLIEGLECAYTLFENGIALCGIEKAWSSGLTVFRKPVSCHLYPIRTKKYREFTAVNYDVWDICQPARLLGSKTGVPVYRFVKDALIRKFGEEWFRELEYAADNLDLKENDF